jgi:TRAP-type C4-dicarboxylate transport system permease small subunit
LSGFLRIVFQLSKWANVLGGVLLTLLMLITVADVFLRSLGRPIVGIFELVAFLGALVLGFSMPFTSWVRGHIYVDFLVLKLRPPVRKAFHIFTRCLGTGLFFLIGWNLIKMGTDLHRSGEVSLTLEMPFHPIVYGVGICCFIQCLVLSGDVVKILEDKYE